MSTIQVRLDTGWHTILKRESKSSGKSIRELIEDVLVEHYDLKTLLHNEKKEKGKKFKE